MDTLFFEIAIVLIAAGVLSLIFSILRQPMIIAYIATGLIIGPTVLGFTGEGEMFHAMSSIGVAFLLFLVGLNLNWRNIKDVGGISLIIGFGQVLFTSLLGFFIGRLFDFDILTSVFISVGFAFSSTIIIVKMLTDKQDIDRFYGRIAVGMLIVQDLIAMVILLLIGTFSNTSDNISLALALTAMQGVVAIGGLWLLAKYILPPLFKYAAKSQELLFLIAISWCFAVASTLHFLGFGIEIGALLAGISLAGSQFHREIESKIRPLRDFFLIIFFIVLGTTLTFDAVVAQWQAILVFSVFILIGNPFIVLLLMRIFGYHPRTGWLVGVTVAQISEFSFIMIALGVSVGMISQEALPLATMVALITIGFSTYLITYSEQIYQRFGFLFNWLENGPEQKTQRRDLEPEIILFGFQHIGEAILPTIKKWKKEYVVVDIDPKIMEHLEEKNIPAEYGDAGNADFLDFVHARKAKLIISTIPDLAVNLDLVNYLKQKRSRASIILTAKSSTEAGRLYEAGAAFVIMPNMLGGELFADMLKKKKEHKQSWIALGKRQKKLFKEC